MTMYTALDDTEIVHPKLSGNLNLYNNFLFFLPRKTIFNAILQ